MRNLYAPARMAKVKHTQIIHSSSGEDMSNWNSHALQLGSLYSLPCFIS